MGGHPFLSLFLFESCLGKASPSQSPEDSLLFFVLLFCLSLLNLDAPGNDFYVWYEESSFIFSVVFLIDSAN